MVARADGAALAFCPLCANYLQLALVQGDGGGAVPLRGCRACGHAEAVPPGSVLLDEPVCRPDVSTSSASAAPTDGALAPAATDDAAGPSRAPVPAAARVTAPRLMTRYEATRLLAVRAEQLDAGATRVPTGPDRDTAEAIAAAELAAGALDDDFGVERPLPDGSGVEVWRVAELRAEGAPPAPSAPKESAGAAPVAPAMSARCARRAARCALRMRGAHRRGPRVIRHRRWPRAACTRSRTTRTPRAAAAARRRARAPTTRRPPGTRSSRPARGASRSRRRARRDGAAHDDGVVRRAHRVHARERDLERGRCGPASARDAHGCHAVDGERRAVAERERVGARRARRGAAARGARQRWRPRPRARRRPRRSPRRGART